MSLFGLSRVMEQDLEDEMEMKRERDMLKHRRLKIEQNVEEERQLAEKSNRNGKKERALQHIKKEQGHKRNLERLDRRLEKLEEKIFQIDLYKIQTEADNTVMQVRENLQNRNELNEVLGDDRYGNADVTNEVQTDGSSTIWTALVVVFGIVIGVGIALLRSSD